MDVLRPRQLHLPTRQDEGARNGQRQYTGPVGIHINGEWTMQSSRVRSWARGLTRLLAAVLAVAGNATAQMETQSPGTALPPPSPITEPPLENVIVEAPEPKYVAPTLRDRIGRIWAPVLINGKGPYRLVLDTGASHSAIIGRVADSLGIAQNDATQITVRGVTGSALVPAIKVDRMEVGDLLIEPSTLPIVADVFGGAEGVLGREGLPDKRILADFKRDRLVISQSHRERALPGYVIVPLKLLRGLLSAEVYVGSIHAHAIIDTGGQQTVGNLALREALMKRPPKDAVVQNIEGVTLEWQRGDMVNAPPIGIGSMKIQNARITFADTFLFEHLKLNRDPTLLVGMDVLGSFDVLIIDYRLRELQIRPRNSADISIRDFGASG